MKRNSMRSLKIFYLNNRLVDKKDIPKNAIFVKRVKCKEFLHKNRGGIIIEKYYITKNKQYETLETS